MYASPVFGLANQSNKIIISPTPAPKTSGILDQFLGFKIFGFPYGFGLIGAIAGVAVVGVLFIRKRRAKGKKEEEGTADEEEMDLS
jgi:hypothetical protein